jgi:hypothetical protein
MDVAAACSEAVDRHVRERGGRTDLGEMAQMAAVESLTAVVGPTLPSLFGPEPAEVQRAIGRYAGGDRFAALAREFFARLTGRSLDYYLSRELSSHTGAGERFADDAARARFDDALERHCREASRIVEDYAGGWYGKNVYQRDGLTPSTSAASPLTRSRRYGRSFGSGEMPRPEHTVLCGGLVPAEGVGPRSLRLALHGPAANVRLRIQDVSGPLVANLPDELVDLLEVATYVYAADSALPRGGKTDARMGAWWRRKLRFVIPVRRPDLWRSAPVCTALSRHLGFLSDDDYAFEFEPLGEPPPRQGYLEPWGTTRRRSRRRRWSCSRAGGLLRRRDRRAGRPREVGRAGQPPLCQQDRVGPEGARHRHARPPGAGQNPPRSRPGQARAGPGPGADAPDALVPVRRPRGGDGAHVRPRPRPVLRERRRQPQPAARGPGGRARATRTTHPQALAGFRGVLAALLGRPFEVANPFVWLTKADVVNRIAAHGFGDLIRHTRSCTRVHDMTIGHPHCGHCSQCVDRRFAILAAGLGHDDPEEAYKVELFTGERGAGPDREMALAYVRMATAINGMTDEAFFAHFGEASRAVGYFPEPTDEAAGRIFDLHRRHAGDVCRVFDD